MIFAISHSYMEAILVFLYLPQTGLFAAATYWSNKQHEVTTTRARLGYGLRGYAPYGRSVALARADFIFRHGDAWAADFTLSNNALRPMRFSCPGDVQGCDMRWCYKDPSMVLRKLTYCVAPGPRPI
jgi:hypothetical protein